MCGGFHREGAAVCPQRDETVGRALTGSALRVLGRPAVTHRRVHNQRAFFFPPDGCARAGVVRPPAGLKDLDEPSVSVPQAGGGGVGRVRLTEWGPPPAFRVLGDPKVW